jgi:ribonuclease-3
VIQTDLSRLERKLGHTFNDKSLLELALTHRSFKGKNNERLEYLGDAILGYIIAEQLYLRFPNSKEGQLSRFRARLVKGVTLAEIAKSFDVGDYLRLGPGELKSGGFRRASILADALESIIGATFLDAGHDAAKAMVLAWYEERLASQSLKDTEKDPKTQLQEFLQARKLPLPSYDVLRTEGEAHSQTFFIRCSIESTDVLIESSGPSRRHAEQDAARHALEQLSKSL